jgi:hypothetical protein
MYESINSLNEVFLQYHGAYFFSLTQYMAKVAGMSSEAYMAVLPGVLIILYFISARIFFRNQLDAILCTALFSITTTFFFLFNNTIRQGLALGLSLIGISLFSTARKRSSYLFFFLAFMAHQSAAVVVCALFIAKLMLSLKSVIIFLSACLLVAIFFPTDLLIYFSLNERIESRLLVY